MDGGVIGDMTPDISTVVVAVIVGLVAITTTLFSGLKDLIDDAFRRTKSQLNKTRYTSGIHRLAEFHALLEQLRSMPFVDRVLIFAGRNCGGIPQAAKPYTVSCFYGFCNDDKKHPEQLYNFPLRVDSHYITMLGTVIETGRSIQTTETMPPGAKLRDYYVTEGVVQSILHYLTINDNELLYLSTGSYSGKFTEAEISQIELIVERIRSLMDETK